MSKGFQLFLGVYLTAILILAAQYVRYDFHKHTLSEGLIYMLRYDRFKESSCMAWMASPNMKAAKFIAKKKISQNVVELENY